MGKKPRTWWQQHGRIASCTSLINCFPCAAKLAWGQTSTPPTPDLSDEVTTLLAFCDCAWPRGLACFGHLGFASVCAFLVANDSNCNAALPCFCPASVLWAGSNESHGLIIHSSFLGNFAPWGNKYDPQVVQHQLQEQEAATGSATLPVMSLLWVLLHFETRSEVFRMCTLSDTPQDFTLLQNCFTYWPAMGNLHVFGKLRDGKWCPHLCYFY